MPDIGTLVELADLFDAGISEIINGEKEGSKMNQEEKDTLLKVADYSENERRLMMKKILFTSIAGLAALFLALLLSVVYGMPEDNPLVVIESSCFGLSAGALLTSILFATGVLSKIRNNSKSRRIAHILRVICPIVVACIVVCDVLTVQNHP